MGFRLRIFWLNFLRNILSMRSRLETVPLDVGHNRHNTLMPLLLSFNDKGQARAKTRPVSTNTNFTL